jgi:hypothetical protein
VEETVNESDSQTTEVLEPQIIVDSSIESDHKNPNKLTSLLEHGLNILLNRLRLNDFSKKL